MFKNVASQQIAVFAYDTDAKLPKTGDAANITAKISKDGGATAATNDVNPTELSSTDAKGIYIFNTLQAESNANLIVLSAVSATENITLEPVIIYTQTVMVGTDGAVTSLTAITDQLDDVQSKTDDIPLHPASTENVAENKTVIDATNIIVGALNDLSSADILAATGITAGGTLTVAEAIKILLAIAAGQVQDKAGVSGTYQVLDAEDGTTVIAEITPSETTPQLTVNI